MNDRTCTIPGCAKPIYVKRDGLCTGHYKRKRLGKPMHPKSTDERFWEKVTESPTGCWEWQANRGPLGHGLFALTTDRPVAAHRYAYERLIGPIPDGLHLDHLCRNPPCVNPWHLDAVPNGVNVLRGDAPPAENARKSECVRGHEFDAGNTYITPDGRRMCRTCQRGRRRRFAATH